MLGFRKVVSANFKIEELSFTLPTYFAKDSLSDDRHSRGQGQECSRPRTQGHKRKCSPKKKGLHKKFSGDLKKKKKKKVFTKIFGAISTKKHFPKNFSSTPQNFNNSKISAVLEPRTGQFSRT